MSRGDKLKSLLRSTLRNANEKLAKLRFNSTLGDALKDAIQRKVRIRDQQMTMAAGRVKGIHAVTVKVSQGRILFHAALKDQTTLVAALIPISAVFAPRGAKDLCFRVEPAMAAKQFIFADVVGAIAGEMAKLIWGPLVFVKTDIPTQAFVERENDLFRIDLRTVPEVRNALRRKATALAIDAIEVKQMVAEDGALCLTLGFQGIS